MTSFARPATTALLTALTFFSLASAAAGAARYDPAFRFRVLSTAHFRVYFHQGEETLARRLAAIAEDVHGQVSARTGSPGDRVTHIVLVDQSDLANGWATPFPYNTIEIAATPPPGASSIGRTDDWLRIVFTHEYVHIIHLDRSRGWARLARNVFGRPVFAFPNLFLPAWQIEGIATFYESHLTGQGRLHSGDFLNILREHVRARGIEPIDRAAGGLVSWPSGAAPYLFGSQIHKYLADEYGEHRLWRLADATAGAVPYLQSNRFRSVYGKGVTELWGAAQLAAGLPRGSDAPLPEQLTRHGFEVVGPRWDRNIPGRIVYSARTPHGFPSLMSVDVRSRQPVRLAWRFLGDAVSPGSRGVLFDQIEVSSNVAFQSDLYALPRRADGSLGKAKRLTRGWRVADPDLSPDGRTLAVTVARPGGRSLGSIEIDSQSGRIASGTRALVMLEADERTSYQTPRWSSDGRAIAVERRRPGAISEIVIVDAASRQIRQVIGRPLDRNVTPAWMPGRNIVLFASERGDQPFNLFAFELDTGREYQVTDLPGGATAPDVSPDGAKIVFVGSTADGYDLFMIPADPTAWREVTRVEDPSPPAVPPSVPETLADERYSPWTTALPRYWMPEAEYRSGRVGLGAGTAGHDVLGRHFYTSAVLWWSDRGRPDWNASYAYDRYRPTFIISASDERPRLETRLRLQKIDLGVLLPFLQIRQRNLLAASLRLEHGLAGCTPDHDVNCRSEGLRPADRHALRLGWSFNSAQRYGYSISSVDGWSAAATTEHVRRALGADGNADAFTGEVRGFIRLGGQQHVLAVRAAAGTATGDRAVRRVFSAAGDGPKSSPLDFGSEALGLLRGFEPGDALGSRVAVVNVDYRWPLRRIERGPGTLPFFVRWVHAAVFADTGHAWESNFPASDLRLAVGGELSLDTVVGYAFPLTMTAGAAWRHDGAGRVENGPAAFVRLGRAF